MIAETLQQGPYQPEFEGYQDLIFLIALVLLFVGLFLAFAGRRVWKHVMSFIGAVIGGLLGFAFGAAVGGWLVGFIVGMLGAMVGSAVFIFLARVGLGVVAGLLAFIVVGALVENALLALVVGAIVFGLTFAYSEVAIGIVTAVVGGLLVGIGMLWMGIEMLLVVVAMFGTIVFGAAFQMTALKDEADRRRTVAGPSVAAAATSPPAPPPMPGRTCPRCGGPLSYIPEYNRYYCRRCQRYE